MFVFFYKSANIIFFKYGVCVTAYNMTVQTLHVRPERGIDRTSAPSCYRPTMPLRHRHRKTERSRHRRPIDLELSMVRY